jgi:hypothetical protein
MGLSPAFLGTLHENSASPGMVNCAGLATSFLALGVAVFGLGGGLFGGGGH